MDWITLFFLEVLKVKLTFEGNFFPFIYEVCVVNVNLAVINTAYILMMFVT